MLINYLKIAFRNLSKNKMLSVIHILGLGIGTAACLLIFQYVYFERSYDRFHDHAEDIYRVPIRYSEGFGAFPKLASNHPGLGPAMKEDFPEVADYTRILHPSNIGAKSVLEYQNEAGQRITANEEKIYLSDSSFFNIFSYTFLAGDRSTALSQPGSIVISSSLARKYFGAEEALGKTLKLDGGGPPKVTVTGVIEDLPGNSHLDFTGLISANSFFDNIGPNNLWIWPEFYTYVLLKPGSDPLALEAKFPAFTEKYMSEIHKEHKFQTYFFLQPLLDIHLKTECANEPTVPGSERTVYFLTLLGVFILVIAWVNYINLSTSKSIERAKEVGVRKTVGANKQQLIGQFLTEAILLNGVGILIGLFLARVFLGRFTEIVGKEIGDSLLNPNLIAHPIFWAILLGSVLFGGLLSGMYPAAVLSSFRPAQVLKGSYLKTSQGITFRKMLVGFQFILSILLIAATLLVSRQLSYMSKKELGYNKEQIVVIRAPMVKDSITYSKSGILASELRQVPMVNSLAKSSEIPGKLISFRSDTRKNGLDKEANNSTFIYQIDEQFLSTFDIPLAAGVNFQLADSTNIFTSNNNKVLVNESLVQSYGFQTADEAVGQDIKFKFGPVEHKAKIIGVVKNYHQRSLKEDYDPILYYYPTFTNWNYYSLNITTTDWQETIRMLEDKQKEIFADNAFEYFFLDEYFDRQYRSEQQFSQVCQLIAALAIFVAFLGFFGLSTLILTQRTKEIGIRTILGANTTSILLLISRDFVKMLLIANVVALPLIIYFGNSWLDNFAFNIGLGWQVFVIPIAGLLCIVFLIISLQLYRTSVLSPIHSLRSE